MVLNKREDRWNEFLNWNNVPNIAEPIVPFKLLFAYATKDFALGVAPYVAMWSHDSTPGFTGNHEWKSTVIGGQIGTVISFDKSLFEASIGVKSNGYEYTATNYTDKTDGGLQLDAFLRGKFYFQKGSSIAFVPYVGFGMFNWTPNPNGTASNEIKNMEFNLGAGINMPVLDDGRMMGGISFGYRSYEVATVFEYSSMSLPKFNLGLEWGFTDWLTGRLGYSRAVFSDKATILTASPNEVINMQYASDPQQTITMGLGLHFGRFSIDGTIGERLLKQGPYVVTGNSNDLFGMISASYNFKK